MTGGRTSDIATQNGVSNRNDMTSTGMTGGGTTDGTTVTIAIDGTETGTKLPVLVSQMLQTPSLRAIPNVFVY